jgi:hypothetical protein
MPLALEPPDVTVEDAAVPTEPIWRMTVDQYHAMVRYRSHRDYAMEEEVPVVIEGREAGRIPVRSIPPPS